jgi:predicted PurR-regulated permease PerM/methylmalonyl-CoA mutase cobalamin-binding subunit
VPASLRLPENNDRLAWFLRLVTFFLVVAVLHVAEDVLMPIAFAVLLAFLLSPLAVRMTRWGLPRSAAILLTVTVAFGVLGATGWIVTSQALALGQELPNYEENIRRKIIALKHPPTPSAVARVSGMMENLRREIKAAAPDQPVLPAPPGEAKPVPVEVKPSEPTPLEVASSFAPPVLRLLGTAVIVIVFVIAILFQREDLRDRLIRLLSAGRLNLATQALDDAASRVSRYLGIQLVVNAAYGVPLGVGLHFIGIPNAPLWGLLATLLRFIPFVGPWIAAAFPVALAIAVDPGWTMLLYTIALFIVLELISNNVVEVLLYGASTGISSFALLLAAVFWTWLWGPPGLVLSTPLTVCVLVIGTYMPGLSVLSMLLGSQPVLDPPAQFYQRMLAMESDEMTDLAGRHIREQSVEDFHEHVFIPALLMTEEDRHHGLLPEARQRFIFQASRELLDELGRRKEARGRESATTVPPSPPEAGAPMTKVLLVPARDEADEIAALVMRDLLRRRGIESVVMPSTAAVPDVLEAARQPDIRAILVSALPPSAVGAARQLIRRLQAAAPGKPLAAGLWHHRAPRDELLARLQDHEPVDVFTTLGSAVGWLERMPRNRAPTFARSTAPLSAGTGEKIAAK